MKIWIICALVLFPLWATAQTPDASLVNAGDETKFRVISRFGPEANQETTQEAGEVEFSRAWAHYEAGRHAQALAEFEGLTNGLFADYALRFGAESALNLKEFGKARKMALRVEKDSIPGTEAQRIAALALLNSDEKAAAQELVKFADRYPTRSTALDARVLVTGLKSVSSEMVNEQWYRIARDFPRSSHRQAALTALKKSKSKDAKAHLDELSSPAGQLRYWNAVYDAHQSQEVVDGLGKELPKFKAGSDAWCEANFLVAHSLTKLRKHAESVAPYTTVIKKCKGVGNWYLRALYLGGKGHWNAGDTKSALELFERIWTEFPKHSYADDAAYFSARIHRSANEDKKADSLLEKQVKSWPDGDMVSDAHWLKIRPLFAAKKYKEIVAYIDSLKETGEQDLYSMGRMAYFRARALELQAGKVKGAPEQAYLAVIEQYPMSYYALMALNQLNGAGIEFEPKPTKGEAVETSAELEADLRFRRGMAFVRQGIDSLAKLEFQELTKAKTDLWQVALLMHKAAAYTYSHDIARRRIDGWMTHYPDENALRWQIGFPAPFEEDVRLWAKKREIPAALVWAIMREESGFSPGIESWANAKGLLQLMDSTAERMAKLDGLKGFEPRILFDSKTNIRLGTRYLSELSSQVDDHPVLMIAGYNGGMGNVGRWLKEKESEDLDLFVEDIPFGQTRNYTKRVLQTYWIYAWLWDGHTVPKFDMKL